MNALQAFFHTKRQQQTPNSSAFSLFFREASSREKKRVYKEVARRANADQQEILNRARSVK